jgi:hypothetical protein
MPNPSADGWGDVALVCARVQEQLSDLASASVARIRREVPGYSAIPIRAHRNAVREEHRRRLVALAEDRAMTADDLDAAAGLARLRASQGISLASLIDAYHIGDQQMWAFLVRAAQGRVEQKLPELAAMLMRSLQAISAALAAAHEEAVRVMGSQRAAQAQRLIELLRADEDHSDSAVMADAALLAQALGFDGSGQFTAVAWRRSESAGDAGAGVGALVSSVERVGGTAVAASMSDASVVLSQGVDRELLGRLTASTRPEPAGMGWTRSLLPGAGASVHDALLASGAAVVTNRFCDVSTDWLMALAAAHTRELEPLLSPLIEVAARRPHLADAVLAFTACGNSAVRAAQRLYVHANTISYRIERWQALTGVDMRLVVDATRSVIACNLARPTGAEQPREQG